MQTPDQFGRSGELIVELGFWRADTIGKTQRCLFRPSFLGEKYPGVDYFIDVLNANGDAIGFFFVQVRSTLRRAESDARLIIQIELEKFNRLVALPIPTYLIGVDVVREKAFIVGASKRRKVGISSITTAFDLNDAAVRKRLHEEVCNFWRQHKKAPLCTEFHDG